MKMHCAKEAVMGTSLRSSVQRHRLVPALTHHVRRWLFAGLAAAVLTVAAGVAAAQGSPSGEYGRIAVGQTLRASIAAATDDLVFHTYVVEVPPDAAQITIRVDGMGSDVDLAVNAGFDLDNLDEADFLDTTEDPNPAYTAQAPAGTLLYVYVLNLLPQPANYGLTVSSAGAAPGVGSRGGAGGANPLAPGDPLVGSFDGDGLQVVVRGGAGAYTGELGLSGQRFPFEASGGNGRLDGTFTSGGQTFTFSATLNGDVLTVISGGATYRTQRIAGGPGQPANPLAPSGGASRPGPSTPANDPVLAEGAWGTLTQDNALAFLEALVFAHEQVGYPVQLTQQELDEYVSVMSQAYTTLTPDEQAALSMSRDIWTRVQANWAQAAPADQQEFVIGMLALWYGEQQVQAWFGSAGAAGGGGGGSSAGCSDIDTCFSQYADPETYGDAMNAQSCWAAAGCSDYDPSYNEFTYEDYSYDSSYD